jgi:hypothetical protein
MSDELKSPENTDPRPTPAERIARSKQRIAELLAEREQKIVRRIIARSRVRTERYSDRNTQNPPSAGSKADYAR